MSSTERYKMKVATYLMPIRNENEILLSRRFNTGWMDGVYSLIAGHLDGDESVHDAMIREAFEEGVIVVKKEDLIPATVLHRKSADAEYVDFFFMVKNWEGEIVIGEPNKCDEMTWYSIDELPENILPYIKEVLENYKKGISFSASGWETYGVVKDGDDSPSGKGI